MFLGTLTGGLLAAPLAAGAQQSGKIWRIGVLGFSPTTSDMVGPQPRNQYVGALLRGFRELGYVYGEHFVTEPRGAQGRAERYPDLAAELLQLQVHVIVAAAAALPALKRTTSTTPIVMPGHPDPLGEGYVQSLARPGGNFTGLSLQSLELTGKRLELLKELVPTPAPLAILWDSAPGQAAGFAGWQAAEATARERGWKLLSLQIRSADEIEGVFRAATDARAGGLLAYAGRVLEPNSRRVADVAAKSRLPVIYVFRFQVEAGGLMCYGADLIDVWRRAATFVDKILKGAKPGDLPVEQPTKFELVINLKTAKALGLTISPSLLLRADQVIE